MSSTRAMANPSPNPNSEPNANPPATPHADPDVDSSSEVNDPSLPEQRHAGKVGYGPNYQAGATLEDKITGLKATIKGKLTHDPDLVAHGRSLKSGEEHRKKITGEDEPNPFENADEDKDKDKADQDADDDDGTPDGAAGASAEDHATSTQDHDHDHDDQRHDRARTPSPSPLPGRARDAPATETLRLGDARPSNSPSASSNRSASGAFPTPYGPMSTATDAHPPAHASPQGMAARNAVGAREQAATVVPEGTAEGEKQRAAGVDAGRQVKHVDARN